MQSGIQVSIYYQGLKKKTHRLRISRFHLGGGDGDGGYDEQHVHTEGFFYIV